MHVTVGIVVTFVALAASATPAHAAKMRKGPYLQDVGPSSASVRVEVDPPSSVSVEVFSDGEKPQTFRDDPTGAFHLIRMGGLSPQTRYRYRVKAGQDSSDEGAFTTAPSDTSASAFSFLIYGDNRTDDTTHASVVRAMTLVPSDFLVNTGDLVEDGNFAAQWQSFFEIEKGLLRDRCVFVAIGNHELLEEAGSNFLRYFGPDSAPIGATDVRRLYRSVRWENTRILFLNGMDAFVSGAARDWLKEELARVDKEPGVVWRIIVSHQGSFSSGPHGNNPRFSSGGLNELFREHKIDLVISGHDHIYERGEEKGLKYLVSGGGGAPLYRVRAPLPSTRHVEPTYHFILADVTPTHMGFSAKRPDGTVIETCGFLKAGEWDCDKKHVDTVAAGAPPGDSVSEKKTSAPASPCACRALGAPSSSVASVGIGLFALLALIRRRVRRDLA